jgi:hypothetical protein
VLLTLSTTSTATTLVRSLALSKALNTSFQQWQSHLSRHLSNGIADEDGITMRQA